MGGRMAADECRHPRGFRFSYCPSPLAPKAALAPGSASSGKRAKPGVSSSIERLPPKPGVATMRSPRGGVCLAQTLPVRVWFHSTPADARSLGVRNAGVLVRHREAAVDALPWAHKLGHEQQQ